MIVDLNEVTLRSIQNAALRSCAEQYVRDYQHFMEKIRRLGIDVEETDQESTTQERIVALAERGMLVRNDGKSAYINRISPACQACQTGIGSLTLSISPECHRDCFFCFNSKRIISRFQGQDRRDLAAEVDALLARARHFGALYAAYGQRLDHLSLTGGEPLLYKKETVRFFQLARMTLPDVYTRLYTCGDHLERETLQALKVAGLNEIRISIRLDDHERARRHNFNQIALSREYIPNVMVEMPVLPGRLEEMKAVLIELERLGVFGINLLELGFAFQNANEYRARGYHVKAKPFRVLYNYSYPGGVPVAGSERICLDLIEFALETGLKLGVHYCSVENRLTSQIYALNSECPSKCSVNIPNVLYFSQRDYFLKSAKVFGADVAIARKVFDENGYRDYRLSPQGQFLEFHVDRIKMLEKLNMEVGLSTNILEKRDSAVYVRELKLDLTTSQTFQLWDI